MFSYPKFKYNVAQKLKKNTDTKLLKKWKNFANLFFNLYYFVLKKSL